jgi:DNA polymerase V
LIDNPPATFFFKLEGLSMIEFGFQPEDILVVDRSLDAKDGHIVVAFVDGERLCKKLEIRDDGAWLIAGHPEFPAIKMTDDSLIWGVVTGRFAKVKA